MIDLLFPSRRIVGFGATTPRIDDATRRIPIIRRGAQIMFFFVFGSRQATTATRRTLTHETRIEIHVRHLGQDMIISFTFESMLAIDVILFDSSVFFVAGCGNKK